MAELREPAPTGSGSQTALAYERLKELILDLELPPGALVTERRLMDMTNCGRTPVREAMQRLQRDGLLRVVPFRGAFIREVSSRDVDEICQMRVLLESFAAGLAARLIAPSQLDALRAILDGLEPLAERQPRECFEADRAFHALIIEASGHGRIRETITPLADQIQRLRYLSAARPERARAAHDEHRRIAEAIAARDPSAAEAAMREHLRHSHAQLLQLVGFQDLPRLAGIGQPRTG